MFLFVRMSFDVARSGSVRSWTCTEIRSDLGAVVFCFFFVFCCHRVWARLLALLISARWWMSISWWSARRDHDVQRIGNTLVAIDWSVVGLLVCWFCFRFAAVNARSLPLRRNETIDSLDGLGCWGFADGFLRDALVYSFIQRCQRTFLETIILIIISCFVFDCSHRLKGPFRSRLTLYFVLPSFTGLELGFPWFYSVVLGFHSFYRILLGFTGFYLFFFTRFPCFFTGFYCFFSACYWF